MGTCGRLWGPMGAYGDLWGPMGAYGDLWGPMGTYGGLWGLIGIYGDIWGPIGTYGDLWGPIGPYGDLWGPMGTFGDPLAPMGTYPGLWGPMGWGASTFCTPIWTSPPPSSKHQIYVRHITHLVVYTAKTTCHIRHQTLYTILPWPCQDGPGVPSLRSLWGAIRNRQLYILCMYCKGCVSFNFPIFFIIYTTYRKKKITRPYRKKKIHD